MLVYFLRKKRKTKGCALYDYQAGSGVPSSSFDETKLQVTYYQNIGGSQCVVPLGSPIDVDGSLIMNLPKEYGLDHKSCALIAYRGILNSAENANQLVV